MENASFLMKRWHLRFIQIGFNGGGKAEKWVKVPRAQGENPYRATFRLCPKDLTAIAKMLYGYSRNEDRKIISSVIVVPK
jgi:hypothetical protein